ncbi:MAG: hypothetical protein ACR2NW_04305 [Thermodesulfobacteriota bacterium]
MAEFWYVGILEEEFNEKDQKMYDIPLRACIELLDMRPKQKICELDEFPELKTGNPLVDQSGYIYVLIKVTQEEIDSVHEGSYKEGIYKLPKTIVETENILKAADQKERERRKDD